LQKKKFLSFILIGALLVSTGREVSAYGIHDCTEWIQHSDKTLLLSKLSRHFLPITVLAGIVAFFTFRWRKKRNMEKLQPVDQVAKEQSDSDVNGREIGVGEEKQNDFDMKRFVDQFISGGEEEPNGVPVEQRIDREFLSSGRIKYDNELIEGITCTLSDNVVVRQLAVLHQDTEKQIDGRLVPVGGGNASCGYHAIKNALILLARDSSGIQEPLNSTSLVRQICAMPNDQ